MIKSKHIVTDAAMCALRNLEVGAHPVSWDRFCADLESLADQRGMGCIDDAMVWHCVESFAGDLSSDDPGAARFDLGAFARDMAGVFSLLGIDAESDAARALVADLQSFLSELEADPEVGAAIALIANRVMSDPRAVALIPRLQAVAGDAMREEAEHIYRESVAGQGDAGQAPEAADAGPVPATS